MEERDLELRNRTYALFVERGRAPAARELGDPQEVVQAWRRLHDAHALVLNAATEELRMLNPFSAVPTAYRVHAGGRWWYANCAWDAVGICAALQVDGRIEASSPTAPSHSQSRCATGSPTRRASSSIVSSRHGGGGTTSSSPEAR